MKLFRKGPFVLLACAGILLASALPLRAELDAKTAAEVRTLLSNMGAIKTYEAMLPRTVAQFRQIMPNIPKEFWDDFEKDFKVDEIVDLIIPIYAKRFTLEELQKINAFYNTPEGKKLAQQLPDISKESMDAGQKWGALLGAKIEMRLKAKGIDFKPKSTGVLKP